MLARTIRTTISLVAFALIFCLAAPSVIAQPKRPFPRREKTEAEKQAEAEAAKKAEQERIARVEAYHAQAAEPLAATQFGKVMIGRSAADVVRFMRALPTPQGRELLADSCHALGITEVDAILAAWDEGDDAKLMFELNDASCAEGELKRAAGYAMLRDLDEDKTIENTLKQTFELDDEAFAEAYATPYPEDAKPDDLDTSAFKVDASLKQALSEREGIELLTLSGSHERAGFVQGYLLADAIMDLLDAASRDAKYLFVSSRTYKQIRELQNTSFTYPESILREMWGVLAGVEAKLENDDDRYFYGHHLDIVDVQVLNSVADWLYLGCSSITVFADAAGEKGPMCARNLDYIRDGQMRVVQRPLVIARHFEDQPERSWLSATWPGMVGVYSAMRRDGCAVFMQDSNARSPRRVGLVPRSVAARRVLEECDAADPIESAAGLFRQQRSFTGSNFHFVAPDPDNSDDIVAAAFEYDGRLEIDGGVTVRRAGEAEKSDAYLVVTNHYCSREGTYDGGSDSTRRFNALHEQLQQYAENDTKVGLEEGQHLMQLVEADTQNVISIHTTYTFPVSKAFYVAFADLKAVSPKRQMVRFDLEDLEVSADSATSETSAE